MAGDAAGGSERPGARWTRSEPARRSGTSSRGPGATGKTSISLRSTGARRSSSGSPSPSSGRVSTAGRDASTSSTTPPGRPWSRRCGRTASTWRTREAGALTVLAREEYVTDGTFRPGDQIDVLVGEIEAAGAGGVRVAVEMTCFLSAEFRFADLIAYEAEYNAVSAGADAVALCQYNRERFPADVLRDVVRVHPYVVVDGTLSENVFYTPPGSISAPRRPGWSTGCGDALGAGGRRERTPAAERAARSSPRSSPTTSGTR